MIDPMTGEGIHHAMEGGKMAAEFLEEAFVVGNFDSCVMKEYQNRWMNRFGHDFKWSALILFPFEIHGNIAENSIYIDISK